MHRRTSSDSSPQKKFLALALSSRIDDLCAELLVPERFTSMGKHSGWLLERYREIVPSVLPDAIRSMESGARINRASLETIRSSAVAMRDSPIPLSVVLRGGVPALRVFSAMVHARETDLGPRDITILMGRAALIAGELGACWAEAWEDARGSRSNFRQVNDGEPVQFVTVPGMVDGPVLEMLVLVASGHSNEQIAAATEFSLQAVKWHLARLMRLWNVRTRTSLVAVALARGVLTTR
jgi:DNA-binding CsgD family transcriptional regulator